MQRPRQCHSSLTPLVCLAESSSLSSTNSLAIGVLGKGTLDIASESVVSNGTGFLGFAADGVANVNGEDAVGGGADVGAQWNNANGLTLGVSSTATGTLNISNAGKVNVGNDSNTFGPGFGSVLSVGDSGSGGNLIANSGSRITNDGLTVAGLNGGHEGVIQLNNAQLETEQLRVGQSGTGTLTMNSSSTVNSQSGSIGLLSGAVGVVNISDSQWNIQGALNVGGTQSSAGGVGTINFSGSSKINIGSEQNTQFGSAIAVSGAGTATDGQLILRNGSVINGADGLIGLGENRSGTVIADGSGTQWFGSEMIVGVAGEGTLSVIDAASIFMNNSSAGFESSAVGNIDISGDAEFVVSGQLVVADAGRATVSVFGGGLLESGNVVVGQESKSNGSLSVQGVDSHWRNPGDAYVGGDSFGSGGSGTLEVSNGASALIGGTLKIWGSGSVSFSDAELFVGTLDLTDAGKDGLMITETRLGVETIVGDFSQSDGAILAPGFSPGLTEIQGNYELLDGVVEFELAGLIRESQYDAIDVMGSTTLSKDGILDIDLTSGFLGSAGDTFLLFDGLGGIQGNPIFDFTDAQLRPGLDWYTGDFQTSGTISIRAVPEPASLALLLIGSIMVGFRRRRIASR